MKYNACLLIITSILVQTNLLQGQFYSTGEAPASVHWHQIKTPNFRIVFPDDMYTSAFQIAGSLEYFLPLSTDSPGQPFRKYPLLIHTSSVLSNGYVTLAPRRMEWVVTTPQDAYAQDWITQLAVHEIRHAAQLNRLNQGFTGVLQGFTGEIGSGVVSSQMPSWFYEGDAVFNETRLSEAGRGRQPGFEMPLRTQIMELPQFYSYDKAVFGSYRNYVPDHYRLGYQMVGYARARYGNSTWTKALDYTARHPFLIWPLAFHLKSTYGIYKSDLYKQTMDSLKGLFNREINNITYSKYESINRRLKKVFTHYLLPKDLGSGNYLVFRQGLSDAGSFVIIDRAGNEKVLFRAANFMHLKSDMVNRQLIWDEVIRDPRWARRDYSVIRIADLNTGKHKALTRRSRYFSPSFSPDGSRIAVTETDVQNRNFFTILHAHNGKRLQQIPVPDNMALQFPVWTGNHTLCAIVVSEAGKQVQELDLEQESWRIILPYSRFDLSELLNYKEYILFRSSFNGIENIYAVSKRNSADLYQVTYSLYGAYHPAVALDSMNLLFSNYGIHGFDLASVPLDTAMWHKISKPGNSLPRWKDQEPNPGGTMTLVPQNTSPDQSYPVKSYRKASHLFRVHSWLPFYTDVEDLREDPFDAPIQAGVMIYSQNLLSTFISSLGYSYSDGYNRIHPVFSWRGWYPVVELSGQLGGPAVSLPLPDGMDLPSHTEPYFEYTLKTYIPLVYPRGGAVFSIQPSAEWQYASVYYSPGDELMKGLHFFHWRLMASHYQYRATRDIYPRWGQSLSASLTQTPWEKGQFGDLYALETTFYFPGLFRHHHLYAKAGHQQQYPGKYLLPINRIDFPRGYTASVSASFSLLQLNYTFPAGYPDLALGPFLYLKRVRVNLFNDWSYGTEIYTKPGLETVTYTGSYHSVGTEITADLHLIRFIFPLSVGFRLGYLPQEQKYFSGFLVNVRTGIF